MIETPFIGQAYTLPSLNASFQRCLNLYAEGVPGETKGKVILKKRSGLKLFVTVTGANRRIFSTSKGRLFSMNGNKLTEISTTGALTERGTINTTSGRVSMADNGDELVIVDGDTGFVFNLLTNILTAIADPDFPDNATHVTFQDGFIIVNDPSSTPAGEFFISGLRDATSWGGLDFGNAEGSPDIINALVSTGRELWLFGPQSTEVFYDSGAALFPFQRINGTYSKIGCFAPFSVAEMETNVFWLGGNEQGHGQVFTNEGYRPRRISTHAIEQEWVNYPNIEDAIAYTYQEGGHKFYVLNFQAGNKTWVYDTTTGWWHETASTDFNTNTDNRFKGNSHAFFNGKNFVADPGNGNIYEVDPLTFTDAVDDDNVNKIKALRNSPHIWNNLDRLFFTSFQVDMETGVGLTTGNGSDPQAMLRWSNDGGHTFSNQLFADIGKIGKFRTRVKFNRLGQSRDRIWELSITDPIKVTLLNTHVEANSGK